MLEDFADALAGGGHVKPIPTVVPDPTIFQDADNNGFRALWVVFGLMVLSSGVFAFLSWNIPVSRRIYHIITTIITLTAAVSYFAMATGHATTHHCTTVTQHFGKHHNDFPDTHRVVCRQVFWARYVDWTITTPLLLLDLCLLAGVDGAHILMAVVADIIMVLSGMFAAFGDKHNAQRWGWYTIACVSYVFVIWHVAIGGYRVISARTSRVKKLFSSLAIFTFILWTVYPVIWAIADGSGRLSVDSEIITYAVLDILAKPVFGFWLLAAHRKIPETNVDIGGWWSQGLGAEGRIRLDEEAT